MLTRKEVATIIAALLYYRQHSVTVVTSVKVSAHLGREVPLTQEEVDHLVVRLVAGEAQEQEAKMDCGCSFDPTSLSDYCDRHRPRHE